MVMGKRLAMWLMAIGLWAIIGLWASLAIGVKGAHAEVTIDITRGNIQPLPIALVDLQGAGSAGDIGKREQSIGRDIIAVTSADLQRSGLFQPVDEKAFIEKSIGLNNRPRFADWRILNAQALVNGQITLLADGTMKVEFRLWDVFSEAQLLGLAYSTEQANWRRIAHIIADAIYQRVTGESGYFDTRIVYIAESGEITKRVKRLAIMDQDGANHRFLTDGSALVLTPRFSPVRHEITYMSYFGNTPRVYLFNIETGKQDVLGAFKGMTFSPRFSPSGNEVVMSFASDGKTNIYVMDLSSRKITQLTDSSAIDTAPSYAPDGKQIVFESDRGGTQQIYVMDSNGGNQKRISFGQGRYGTPVWSPRGDLIAFTKISGGQFYIGVMKPDGSAERLLVEGYHNEGPTWAPNGRVLMFFRATPKPDGSRDTRIFSVDLTGGNLRQILTPGDASDPAWSPLNP